MLRRPKQKPAEAGWSKAVLAVATAAGVLSGPPGPARAQIVLEPIVVEGATLQGDPVEADNLGASATVITGAELSAGRSAMRPTPCAWFPASR
jgi:hypothetical protein